MRRQHLSLLMLLEARVGGKRPVDRGRTESTWLFELHRHSFPVCSATIDESSCVSALASFGEGIRARWWCFGIPGQKESLGNWRILSTPGPGLKADGQWRLFSVVAKRLAARGMIASRVPSCPCNTYRVV